MTKKTHTGLIAVEMDLTRICSGPGVGFSTSFTTSKGAFASLVMAAFIFPLFFFVSCDIYTCYYQNLKGVVDPMYIGPCVFVCVIWLAVVDDRRRGFLDGRNIWLQSCPSFYYLLPLFLLFPRHHPGWPPKSAFSLDHSASPKNYYSFRTICTLYTKALSRAHCGMLCKNSVEACNLISRVERQDDEIPLT